MWPGPKEPGRLGGKQDQQKQQSVLSTHIRRETCTVQNRPLNSSFQPQKGSEEEGVGMGVQVTDSRLLLWWVLKAGQTFITLSTMATLYLCVSYLGMSHHLRKLGARLRLKQNIPAPKLCDLFSFHDTKESTKK